MEPDRKHDIAAPDLLVIGAGPAGMAAALTAADHGAAVTIIDEQASAGGQIYRGLADIDNRRASKLGQEYTRGKTLTDHLHNTGIACIHGATVWSVDKQKRVTASEDGHAFQINPKAVIIATGALERPYPISGWTLPGVMTAGAAQILLKTSGLTLDQPILAGTGPLLYAVANQILAQGGRITAIVDTVSLADYRRAAAGFPFKSIGVIGTGLTYLRNIKKAGIPHYRHCTNLKVAGQHHAEGLTFTSRGTHFKLVANHVLLHQGVVPNVQLSRSLGLHHQWHSLQRCFHPALDQWGASSVPGIYIAGDGSGIGGAINAEHQGRIAALGALSATGSISSTRRDQLAKPSQRLVQKSKKLRLFLDTLYAPPADCVDPRDDVVICRCEEVTAGEIRNVAALGCTGPNQTKAFCRSGMGPCQGRYCGNTVTEILAKTHARPHDEIGYYRIRAPIKPVTLAELAELA
jgi:NADPH-dependent 2,4-dienoyl-CoA reductase/sulfur reductase-like enzyme